MHHRKQYAPPSPIEQIKPGAQSVAAAHGERNAPVPAR
jgi:hypothetical protein